MLGVVICPSFSYRDVAYFTSTATKLSWLATLAGAIKHFSEQLLDKRLGPQALPGLNKVSNATSPYDWRATFAASKRPSVIEQKAITCHGCELCLGVRLIQVHSEQKSTSLSLCNVCVLRLHNGGGGCPATEIATNPICFVEHIYTAVAYCPWASRQSMEFKAAMTFAGSPPRPVCVVTAIFTIDSISVAGAPCPGNISHEDAYGIGMNRRKIVKIACDSRHRRVSNSQLQFFVEGIAREDRGLDSRGRTHFVSKGDRLLLRRYYSMRSDVA
jgi:hypothetical protein